MTRSNAAASLVIAVPGRPVPQGSKSGVVDKVGRVQILEGRSSTQRKAFHEWRAEVANCAWVAMHQARRTSPFVGPVAVEILFVHKRPASTPKGHRWRAKTPDVDKLARAVLDGLKAGAALGDDNQVAELVARKVLALPDEGTGAVITVTPLDHAHGPTSAAQHLPAPQTPHAHPRGPHRPQRASTPTED